MLRCVAGVVYVEPFREIRPGSVCRCRGRRQSRHHDGSPGPGALQQQRKPPRQRPRLPRIVACPRRRARPPAGSHWYYRIDRVTKRQCWYLREESDTADDKFARAAPPASAPTSARSFGRRGAGVAAATNHHAQVDRRRACRMGFPATPRRTKSARQSRASGCGGPPHRSCKIARAQPCRTCWRRRRCRRCDGMTLPPRRVLHSIQPISRSPPPIRPQRQPPQAEEVQQPAVDQVVPAPQPTRRRQSRPHRCRSCCW